MVGEWVRKELAETLTAGLETEDRVREQGRLGRPDDPAIDVEDYSVAERSDWSLVWSTYRRSPVVFGGGRLLEDSEYVNKCVICFASSARVVLDALQKKRRTKDLYLSKLQLMLEILTQARAAVDDDIVWWRAYAKYHRDLLLRYVAVRATGDLRHYAALQGALTAHAAKRSITGAVPTEKTVESISAWGASLRDIAAYVRDSTDVEIIEPNASDCLQPIVFKIIHIVANQLGLRILDEAYSLELAMAMDAGLVERAPITAVSR